MLRGVSGWPQSTAAQMLCTTGLPWLKDTSTIIAMKVFQVSEKAKPSARPPVRARVQSAICAASRNTACARGDFCSKSMRILSGSCWVAVATSSIMVSSAYLV